MENVSLVIQGCINKEYKYQKMAVETGFIISQKKYFSSGKYFSMKTVAASMPAGMKVVSLNGKSTQIILNILMPL